MTPLRLTRLDTPIGAILLVATDVEDPLSVLEFEDQPHRLQRALLRHGPHTLHPGPSRHTAAVRAYFAGQLTALDAIPCAANGTPFQRRTWSALRAIPPGAPTTYAALARQIGHPTAIRAVGAANGANPLSIVVPCHRLVGTNGALTGYGGGVARKAWLLAHERRYAAG